jgi:hypothetical protein
LDVGPIAHAAAVDGRTSIARASLAAAHHIGIDMMSIIEMT